MLALTSPRRALALALALAASCLLVPDGDVAVEAVHAPLTASTMVAPPPAPASASASPVGLCDPRGGPRVPFTPDDRREVRDRVLSACKLAGDAPIMCAFYDAVVMRESRGRSSIRHTRAEGEDGLGPMGLSLRWHADKWPGDADPAWCTPEASLAVARAIVRRAWVRYDAVDLLDVQAIYSGRWGCSTLGGRRQCYADPSGRTRSIICGAMRRRGYSCHTKLKPGDFGKTIRKRDRAKWVDDMAAAFEVAQ